MTELIESRVFIRVAWKRFQTICWMRTPVRKGHDIWSKMARERCNKKVGGGETAGENDGTRIKFDCRIEKMDGAKERYPEIDSRVSE